MPIDPRDPASLGTLSRGRCFLYVFPCAYEDLLKLGFSRDPLQRLQSLHRRWFEFFDPNRMALVETDRVRDARALELALKYELAEFNAPVPLTVARDAGGHGEWYRGAGAHLGAAVQRLAALGYGVHAPARDWLRRELERRCELLYSWSEALLGVDELDLRAGPARAQQVARDVLDAYTAFNIVLEPWLPANVLRWYAAGGDL
jgi:hypothetical protein